ncbi:asparagine synthase (glutamine-hydrolyzing) [Thalassospira sp. TSL5-1]|uniref:asparagine synthase (glutamine-hydrolyzing) n=1 Tax=Thalassospira sp. TSL5-1 TaxID=1544451 RepID=UPI000939FD2A|nr:asparagine synthase (glutamine-hydrolyzing) [Thalassospira sp. TSL5-1]OKH87124.1 asparagine synthase [Thalassospira sp. TSL5-1]
MCGITGLWTPKQTGQRDNTAIVTAMNAALLHRGPDGGDIWVDDVTGIALGQRRLAIIDLSDAGKQPMPSADGRYVMVYNGEIYNAEDLRAKLARHNIAWRGHSDSEVILEAFAHWGVTETLKLLIGMFAIVLWDKERRRMVMVRDRLGIKPLYWTHHEGCFAFASELKALVVGGVCPREVDSGALDNYLRFGYVPSGQSIYRKTRQVRPGHMIEIDAEGQIRDSSYWSMEDVVLNGRNNRWAGDDASAIDALEDLLRDAVERRMVADVPLGAFLSGGIDSSTIVALMQSVASKPVKTYSIGFEDEAFNEAAFAGAVAKHLGTDHTELYVTAQDALNVVPKLADMYDEPFFDSSGIPTALMSSLTRKDVTVALSGDGGDETFGGYNRYLWSNNLARTSKMIPFGASHIASALTLLSPRQWDRVCSVLPVGGKTGTIGDKIHKVAPLLAIRDDIDRYIALLELWDPETLRPYGRGDEKAAVFHVPGEKFSRNRNLDYISAMQVMDTMMYMVDDVLTKVDRASMAASLEVRVPLMDHRVIEFGWRLPAHLKIHDGTGKIALRRILQKYVPDELINRPKTGFGVPLAEWLRGPLRDWAQDLLARTALYEDFGLDRTIIETAMKDHQAGRTNNAHKLWSVLMLSAWQQRWLS